MQEKVQVEKTVEKVEQQAGRRTKEEGFDGRVRDLYQKIKKAPDLTEAELTYMTSDLYDELQRRDMGRLVEAYIKRCHSEQQETQPNKQERTWKYIGRTADVLAIFIFLFGIQSIKELLTFTTSISGLRTFFENHQMFLGIVLFRVFHWGLGWLFRRFLQK